MPADGASGGVANLAALNGIVALAGCGYLHALHAHKVTFLYIYYVLLH
jgi:hypothetical protein